MTLPHTFAVFPVVSTLVYCCNSRHTYDTNKCNVNATQRSPATYITRSRVYAMQQKNKHDIYQSNISALYCILQPLKKLRVGVCDYVNYTFVCCITRTRTCIMYNTRSNAARNGIVLVLASKLTCLLWGWSK